MFKICSDIQWWLFYIFTVESVNRKKWKWVSIYCSYRSEYSGLVFFCSHCIIRPKHVRQLNKHPLLKYGWKYCHFSFTTRNCDSRGTEKSRKMPCVTCSWKAGRLSVRILPTTEGWSQHTTPFDGGHRSTAVSHCCLDFIIVTTSCSSSHLHRQDFVDWLTYVDDLGCGSVKKKMMKRWGRRRFTYTVKVHCEGAHSLKRHFDHLVSGVWPN